ncbi:diguanylate cyclase/phosphodiesterase with GAF sensor [Gluconacetobacter diazotrophicus PA1 5]|uniref:EAL domain-containing protein n=1 Tax=Gluconacetobacter diazotrophicus TaxID=33996 RepID=UPI000173DB4C|nr:EAL domain-containing protein [Gluconacetobacter diazotrophicus]ACI52329.1 diguanylate cyclase/phosphodiesterase with GAF sensor [Gluconacetobacter diazotrophicus PA1 5]TWA98091.1 diguanylate cyclase (GGDEF)-like protein [Gluconacetobacter diazotrophicus]
MRVPRPLLPASRHLATLAEGARDNGQRKRLQRLERLNGFNAFLARVGMAFDPAMDETALLHAACEAATRTARLRAAFVARPDAGGDFHPLAYSGPVPQLHDPAFSASPDMPARHGHVGRAWHDRQPVFCADIAREDDLRPWQARMRKLAVRSCAALPLWRAGRVWAVFGVYDAQDDTFDPAVRTILLDAVAGLSRALRTQDELRSRAAQIDRSQVGIVLLRDTRIHRANAFAAALVGCTPNDLHNAPADAILADRTHGPQLERAQAQLRDTGQARLSGVHLAGPDGQDVIADLSAVMLDDPPGTDSVWTIENVTAREETQRLYRALINAVSAMLAAEDEAEKCRAVCDTLVDGTLFNAVWLAQPDLSGRIRVRAHAGKGGDVITRLKWQIDMDADTLPMTVRSWREEDLVYTNDPATDLAAVQGYWQIADYRWRGVLSVPVLRGGQIWAVLAFTTQRIGGFDDKSITLCRRVADLMGQSLDRLDTSRNLEKLRHEEARLARRDALTALPNRLALEEYLPKAQERATERGMSMAIGLMDLDGFKAVNDTYGHAAGDKVLAELSRRLWEALRETGYVARLGGDEFVVVLENLDAATANEQAAAALDSLASVVAEPFVLDDGKTARVGLTMGVALFPQDGDRAEALLRRADNAMYRAKQNPNKREANWHFAAGLDEALDLEDDAAADLFPIAPYGTKAADLLVRAARAAARIADSVRMAAIPAIWKKSGGAPVLANLTQEQHERLNDREAKHLEFLVAPTTGRKDVLAAARTLGTMYTLFGVDPVVFVAEQSGYMRLLLAEMEAGGVSGDDRYLVQQIVEARYRDDRRMRRLIGTGVHKAYAASLSDEGAGGAWGQVSADALTALARLPGIQAAFLGRPNAAGELVAQSIAGPCAPALDEALLRGDARPVIARSHHGAHHGAHPGSHQGSFIGARAWRTGERQTCPSIELDDAMAPWHTLMADLRIHSAMSVPVRRQDGTTALVLTLFGACPNQFESADMRKFAIGLQEKWERLWRDGQGMSAERSSHLRERLFSGGLHMFMQPVIDLRTGRLLKVEALARLKDADGTILPPATFLTLLGHDELDRLFQIGLEQGLAWLQSWDAKGVSTELSVNMPPSCLSNANVLRMVGDMLDRYDIAPGRLTLEVLENQALDSDRQGTVLRDFRAMGVQMAIDDLGAGHSNLLRLSATPFDCIKVDRGLLRHIRDVPLQIFSVIRSLREMGHDLHSQVVMEGLEDADMIEAMRHLGCRYGQGFGIARPMPADDFLDWYRTRSDQDRKEEDSRIHSDLGALAYLWAATRGHPPPGGFHLKDGPLTRWLEKRGRDDPDAVRWYRILSAGPVTEETARDMREWLADRVTNAQGDRGGRA